MRTEITLSFDTQLLNEFTNLDWQETKKRQELLEDLLTDMFAYTPPLADSDSGRFSRALSQFAQYLKYQPIHQEPLTQWFKNVLIDKLSNIEDELLVKYVNDLTSILFEMEIADHTYFMYTYESRRWISSYGSELTNLPLDMIEISPIIEPNLFIVEVLFLMGQSLFQSPELQSVIDEHQQYESQQYKSTKSLREKLLSKIESLSIDDLATILY